MADSRKQFSIDTYFACPVMSGAADSSGVPEIGPYGNTYSEGVMASCGNKDPLTMAPTTPEQVRPNHLVADILKHKTDDTTVKLSENELRNLLTCPLSNELLVEPVVAADGITYERTALMAHLKQNNDVLPDGKTKDDVSLYEGQHYNYKNRMIADFIEKELKEEFEKRNEAVQEDIKDANTLSPEAQVSLYLNDIKRRLDGFSQLNTENRPLLKLIHFKGLHTLQLQSKVDRLLDKLTQSKIEPEEALYTIRNQLREYMQHLIKEGRVANPDTKKTTYEAKFVSDMLKMSEKLVREIMPEHQSSVKLPSSSKVTT